MNPKEKLLRITEYFSKNLPTPSTELKYSSEYELAVAVVLSAQCTDKRVNQIVPNFVKKFPNFKALSEASPQDVYQCIKSCSYPNNKTKYLINLSKVIVKKYRGRLPDTFEKLMELPGIGRKSANVLLSILKKEPVIAVDTHVFRVSKRLGLVKNAKTPLSVEKQIYQLVENKSILNNLHHWLVLHGRYVCISKNPKCYNCSISNLCDYKNNLG